MPPWNCRKIQNCVWRQPRPITSYTVRSHVTTNSKLKTVGVMRHLVHHTREHFTRSEIQLFRFLQIGKFTIIIRPDAIVTKLSNFVSSKSKKLAGCNVSPQDWSNEWANQNWRFCNYVFRSPLHLAKRWQESQVAWVLSNLKTNH